MQKIIFFFGITVLFASCNGNETKTAGGSKDSASKSSTAMPYTATYSSSFSTDVSDADLNMVLMSYKDWETGNMAGLEKAFGDSLDYTNPRGVVAKKSKADLMKMWTISRDSLSSVKIDMAAWHKMYATDKKDAYVVTWYTETDTYKDGKVDSAEYHDINQIKNGKITWYSQYKRPLAKK